MAHDGVVHLIDDDPAVRHAVQFLLTSSGFAVRVYESAVAFLAALPGLRPGCIVTDVRMPEMDGLALQQRLQAAGVTAPVIVITGHGDVPLAVTAMKAGAADFIEKPFQDEVLLSTVRAALARHDQTVEQAGQVRAINARLAALSPRERAVLEGVVAGLANKTIAYDLGISARTVEVHRANLMTKMAAANLSELVRMVYLAQAAGIS